MIVFDWVMTHLDLVILALTVLLNLALLDDSEHIKIVTRVIRSLKDPAFLKKMDECDEEELKVLLNDYFLTEKLDD